jgi:RHH-type rel operon transcriptional repressor/antitoxin RelB
MYIKFERTEDMLALRLPEEIESRLNALAERTGRTKSFYARQAIIEYLGDIEAQYWDDQVIRRWESSDKQTISADEFKSELGL